MKIRSAHPSDGSTIAELHAASWQHAYRGILNDEYLATDCCRDRQQVWESRFAKPERYQHVFVAESQRQLVGFACLYGNHSAKWGSLLDNMHVARNMQGNGAGTMLLNAIADCCTRLYAAGGLYLWVLQSNTDAQGFYARFGAINTGVDIWLAPDGSEVPRYRCSWKSAQALQLATNFFVPTN